MGSKTKKTIQLTAGSDPEVLAAKDSDAEVRDAKDLEAWVPIVGVWIAKIWRNVLREQIVNIVRMIQATVTKVRMTDHQV